MLPQVEHPLYPVTLKSNGRTLSIRPFMVKENKIFMMAAEAKDNRTMLDAVRQVIRNCVQDEIDVNALSMIDLEWLFVNLRARSIGEVVTLNYRCTHNHCNTPFSISVNVLDDVTVIGDASEKRIPLSDTIGIVMRPPRGEMIEPDAGELDLRRLVRHIDHIYDADAVYQTTESTVDELIAFVENNVNEQQFLAMLDFMRNQPVLGADREHTCAKCGFVHRLRLRGLADFFT